jgi:hypothetical protein
VTDQGEQDTKALDKCPNCFSDLDPEDPVCGKCGFDTMAGQGMPPSGVDEEDAGS